MYLGICQPAAKVTHQPGDSQHKVAWQKAGLAIMNLALYRLRGIHDMHVLGTAYN